MILSLTLLKKRAKDRPEGYLEDVLAVSTVVGDLVEISVDDLNRLRVKYQPQHIHEARECGCCKQVS